jgi:predicted RNA-binding Zn ribbon-like protein
MTNPQPHDHRHAAALDDTLDFLNTDELDGNGHPIERLAGLSAATEWLAGHGLLHAEDARRLAATPARRADHVLSHVHCVRAAMREIVEALVAGRAVDPAAVAAVNAVLRARAVVELEPREGALVIGHRHVGDHLDDALAAVAAPLVAAIAANDIDRLRICANDGCRWVFHDGSRTGRRRWCSMASCGNRAKAARHRARKRSSATPREEAVVEEMPAAGA